MAKKIFGVYLAKLDAPDSEAHARLELPASPWELHDALDKVQLQENEELYLEVDDYYDFEYLAPHLDGADISLNELNDLAGQLAALDEVQGIAFEGLFSIEMQKKISTNGGIITLQDLRNLAASASADCCHVVDASSDAELGRFYAENGFVEELDGLSDDVFEMLDFGKISKALRAGENGTFTRNGYVVQHSELVTVPPCSRDFPKKPDYLFRLTLGLHPDLEDGRTVTLTLPASAEELKKAQRQLGADSWEGVVVLDYDGIIPQAAEFADLPAELEAFNHFAEVVEAMPSPEKQIPKLKAVLSAGQCSSVDQAILLAERLEHFNLDAKIYDMFLSGTPVRGIQEYLNENAVPNINGEPKWARSAIDSILTNEKYCGDVLLQKTYIDDCINKKVKKNTGQLPMYLVQNHHEGIIRHETFDAVQAELAHRSAGKSPSKKNAPTGRSRYSSKCALSDRLYCGECGTRYQRCTWRNRDGSKRIVWRCVSRVDYGNTYCHDSPTLDEEPLHRAILAAINSAVKDKDTIIYNLKSAMEKELAPVAGQQLSLSEIDNQLEQLNIEFSKVLAEASESGDQAVYSDRFREIMQKQTALKAQRDKIQGMLVESGKAAAHIDQCRQAAESIPATITEWDEALIRQVVESVTVEMDSKLAVQLKRSH